MSLSLRKEALDAIKSAAMDVGKAPFKIVITRDEQAAPWDPIITSRFTLDAVDLGEKKRSIASVPEILYHQTYLVAGGEYAPAIGDKLSVGGVVYIVKDVHTLSPFGVAITHTLYVGS